MLVAVLAGATAVLSFGGVAGADRGAIRDARGDAKAPWDITKIFVRNGRRTLRIQVVYRGRLRPKHTAQGLLTAISLDMNAPADSTYDRDFEIDMLRGSGNPRIPNRLQLVGASYRRVPCRGLRLRARYRRGRLVFRVPQRCFGSRAGRVRVRGHTYSPRGAPDEADYIRRWSRWVKRG